MRRIGSTSTRTGSTYLTAATTTSTSAAAAARRRIIIIAEQKQLLLMPRGKAAALSSSSSSSPTFARHGTVSGNGVDRAAATSSRTTPSSRSCSFSSVSSSPISVSSSPQSEEVVIVDRHHGSSGKDNHKHEENEAALSSTTSETNKDRLDRRERSTKIPRDGLSLSDFVHRARHGTNNGAVDVDVDAGHPGPATLTPTPTAPKFTEQQQQQQPLGTFHIKTYGCQMNVSDSDIVRAVLLEHGYAEATMDNTNTNTHANTNTNTNTNNTSSSKKQQQRRHKKQSPAAPPESTADIVLTNTCAIREKAEEKVWQRLRHLRKNKAPHQIVGVLGCMAERLQNKLLEENVADLVVGPDAYRDLPRLLAKITGSNNTNTNTNTNTDTNADNNDSGNNDNENNNDDDNLQQLGQQLVDGIPMDLETPKQQQQHTNRKKKNKKRPKAINVDLSTSETYDDIIPVRGDEASNPFSAFVSIQRGCSNRCSFCIVPFTRGGKERSRPFRSIVDEVSYMVETQDLKEVVLLGQNVNSYHDRSPLALRERPEQNILSLSNEGFRSRIRRHNTGGYRFVDLVEAVADVSPELRIRYTSPHPKDYPLELLQLMAERPNVCSQLHMPAQSGSTEMLKRMKRGYTREAYVELIDTARTLIPDVAISSDFIAGFCDETEEEHADTLSLLEYVEYEQAFLFAYSMRDKTHASRAMEDNVAAGIKQRRLQELIDVFREKVHAKNERVEIGRLRLVLVEGPTRKQRAELPEGAATWHGRTDQNKRILFEVDIDVETNTKTTPINPAAATATAWKEDHALELLRRQQQSQHQHQQDVDFSFENHAVATTDLAPGDYAVVSVTKAKGHTLRGRMLWKTTLSDFARFESRHLSKLQPQDLNIFLGEQNRFRIVDGIGIPKNEGTSLRSK